MPELCAEFTAWLDASSLVIEEVSPALFSASATVAGASVYIVASDPTISRGALGIAEAELFRRAILRAKSDRVALLLYIDSAGAKLSEGVAIQGALRKLVIDLLDASMSGLKIVAVLGRNVFGGASFLSFIADSRVYADDTRLAMTGPSVLTENNVASKESVAAVIQSPARVEHGASDFSSRHCSFQQALQHKAMALPSERELLKERLIYHKLLVTPGTVRREGEHCVYCEGSGNVGAADALLLAETLDACVGPIELHMTWQAHSLRLADEEVLLSQYLMHLAKSIRRLVAAGTPVTLHIDGHIAGGFYLAVAGPASRVVLHSSGSIRTLPKAALATILNKDVELEEGEIDPIEYGLADEYAD